MRYGFIITVLMAVLVFNGCKDKEKEAAAPEVTYEDQMESNIEPLVVPKVVYEDEEGGNAPDAEAPAKPIYDKNARIRKANGEEVFYHTELAITEKQQLKGLMFREGLLPDYGMLFIFEEPFIQGFWMRNVFMPLDMLFVGEDGVVHHIQHMAAPMNDNVISASAPSRAVFELAGGEAKAQGIAVGDVILHNAFTSKK